MIGIIGRIQTRNYENQQGQKVYVTEVIGSDLRLMGSKKAEESGSQSNQGYDTPSEIDDDDLPF